MGDRVGGLALRAFKIFRTLGREKQLGTRCARQLLAALRGLDAATLREQMEGLRAPGQLEALLARRDQIVAYYDARIAELGETAVLYELPRRSGAEPKPR